MRMSEVQPITVDAKKQWIDDNIRRLDSIIHLEGFILESKLAAHERVRIQTQQSLNESERDRFIEMKKGGSQDDHEN